MSSPVESEAAPNAAMVAIGDELLSGRTRDSNIHYLAGWLSERGVALREVRIVADIEANIIRAVNELRMEVDYVFTCGGIGPTHDDITAPAIAAAFKTGISERDDALGVLEAWYAPRGEEVTPARRRMARIPDGATLIRNPVSGAPGFRLENVFVMAGVPAIFQAMLAGIDDQIARGVARMAMTVLGEVRESTIADGLARLEARFDGLTVGSYPGKTGMGGKVAVLLRSARAEDLPEAAGVVADLMRAQGAEPEIVDGMVKVD